MSTTIPGCGSARNFCRSIFWESRILTRPGSSELDHCTRVDCGITEEAKLSLYLWECRIMNKEKREENFKRPIGRSKERLVISKREKFSVQMGL